MSNSPDQPTSEKSGVFSLSAKTAADSRSFCVYRHTAPNGKVYIGITAKRPEVRWGSEGRGYRNNRHFFSAVSKYGWDNITHEILAVGLSKAEAEEMEIRLIRESDSTNPACGYNHATGGGVNCGFRLSEARKAEIRDFMREREVTAETREKLRQLSLGRRHTEASKAKMRAAKLGKKLSAETREKMRISNRGKRIRAVVCVDSGVVYPSLHDAERATGAKHENISKVCRGERHTAAGLRWRYTE